MFWFILYLFGAFYWFSWGVGLVTYEPWVVTFAFIWLGINMVVSAMKELIEWADSK